MTAPDPADFDAPIPLSQNERIAWGAIRLLRERGVLTGEDGGAMDPRIARVLVQHREAVAQATERAYLELHGLGVSDPGRMLRR